MQIKFSELGQRFFSVTDLFAVKQTGNGKTRFIMENPRHSDALLYYSKTCGICYQEGKEPLFIPCGALVYLPKNSKYMWENSPAEGYDTQENILFEFNLKNINIARENCIKNKFTVDEKSDENISFSKDVCIVSANRSSVYKPLMYSLLETFETASSPLSVYAEAYAFFNSLSNNCKIEEKNFANAEIIKKSIGEFEDFSSEQKSIREIAANCNVSVGYYERLFKNYTGMTPIEYRNIFKINKIKMFLQNPDATLDEIAEKMRCCDSGYLCRLFKQKTGMTPKEYRKMYLAQVKNFPY